MSAVLTALVLAIVKGNAGEEERGGGVIVSCGSINIDVAR